jgi:hypothetical protein
MKQESSTWQNQKPARQPEHRRVHRWAQAAACTAAMLLTPASALANGGPFVIKYPGGDPAAKGVLARLDPDLKPARESRLQVVKEDLSLRFEPNRFAVGAADLGRGTPLVAVSAAYLITNPASDTVELDFGFPILRGIYMNPHAMMPMPDVQVRMEGSNDIRPVLISNSAIYGLLRRKAEEAIDRAIEADAALRQLCLAVQTAPPTERGPARLALTDYLTAKLKWTAGDATLLVEYAALRRAKAQAPAASRSSANQVAAAAPGIAVHRAGLFFGGLSDASVHAATSETAWATGPIGEQKATQWLTTLAGRLDPASANSYEAIFQAWGGDVRERSVDLATGKVRPREISRERAADASTGRPFATTESDPAIYARVDYLDANKKLTADERASWGAVLKKLPVVFTFAPMNLLHYHVAFPPNAQRTLTVSYRQYAYLDTASPQSYQIAYVVHPASLWDSFGPIHLTVIAPTGVTPVCPLPLRQLSAAPSPALNDLPGSPRVEFHSFGATLTGKTGELFVGISAEAWKNVLAPKAAAAR